MKPNAERLVGPQPVKVKQTFSEFVEGVSCPHPGGHWTYCGTCGTRCKRDKEGLIVEYDRGTLDLNRTEG